MMTRRGPLLYPWRASRWSLTSSKFGASCSTSITSVLLDVLSSGKSLDPITVWRCGAHALFIDGHHRLEAYKRHELKSKELTQVPVTWLDASLDKAIEEAAADNVKTRLVKGSYPRATAYNLLFPFPPRRARCLERNGMTASSKMASSLNVRNEGAKLKSSSAFGP